MAAVEFEHVEQRRALLFRFITILEVPTAVGQTGRTFPRVAKRFHLPSSHTTYTPCPSQSRRALHKRYTAILLCWYAALPGGVLTLWLLDGLCASRLRKSLTKFVLLDVSSPTMFEVDVGGPFDRGYVSLGLIM